MGAVFALQFFAEVPKVRKDILQVSGFSFALGIKWVGLQSGRDLWKEEEEEEDGQGRGSEKARNLRRREREKEKGHMSIYRRVFKDAILEFKIWKMGISNTR